MTTENGPDLLPEFRAALADIPDAPKDLCKQIVKTIKRRQIVSRSAWAVAACMCLAFSAMFLSQTTKQPVAYAAETFSELASVNTYYNDSGDKEILDLDVENVLY